MIETDHTEELWKMWEDQLIFGIAYAEVTIDLEKPDIVLKHIPFEKMIPRKASLWKILWHKISTRRWLRRR